tara:strand:+ start:1900 stop:2163 length:264 start_codon:yes stop_codon:yes gene_type:complete
MSALLIIKALTNRDNPQIAILIEIVSDVGVGVNECTVLEYCLPCFPVLLVVWTNSKDSEVISGHASYSAKLDTLCEVTRNIYTTRVV